MMKYGNVEQTRVEFGKWDGYFVLMTWIATGACDPGAKINPLLLLI